MLNYSAPAENRAHAGHKPLSCSGWPDPRPAGSETDPRRIRDPVCRLSVRFQGGPRGPLAPPTRTAQPASRFARARLASDAGRLARKAKPGVAEPEEVGQAAADLTREPSRRPSLGKRGQARSQPNPRTSVRAAAPCQIRHSASEGLTLCRRPTHAIISGYCQGPIDASA